MNLEQWIELADHELVRDHVRPDFVRCFLREMVDISIELRRRSEAIQEREAQLTALHEKAEATVLRLETLNQELSMERDGLV
ncbi:MAG: hypothetical protein AAGD07_10320 [Planctomycetota bacterium]